MDPVQFRLSAERPAWRVSLDIGHSPGRDDGTWAGLTPAEARTLAAALLGQAAAAERDAGPSAASPAAERIDVAYAGGESYAVAARGQVVLTDQPVSNGGADAALTPTDLLVGALATCVAFYAATATSGCREAPARPGTTQLPARQAPGAQNCLHVADNDAPAQTPLSDARNHGTGLAGPPG